MKKKVVLAIMLLGNVGLYAQTGIGTTLPNPTSILDVASTTKGMLIPRVDLLSDTDKSTIKGGDYPESLIVYHNGTKDLIAGFYYWEKKKWNVLISNTNLYEYIKKEAKQDTVMIKYENGDYIFTWKDDKGVEQTMKISDVIKKFETLTEFKGAIEGSEAVLTYKPERGVETKVLLTDLLKKSTDFETYIKSLITGNIVVPTTVVANGSGTEVAKTIDTNSNTTTYKVSIVPTEIDLTGDVGGKAGDNTINKIKKVTVSPTPPTTTGQALVYNDATKVWEPGKPTVNTGDITGKANLTTDGVIVVGDATTGTNSSANSVLAATTLSIKNASITGGKIANRTLTANHLAIVEASDFNSVLSTDTKGNPQWFVKGNLTTDNIIVVGKGDSGANTSGHFPLLAPMELSIRNASITGTQIANKAITVGKIADGGADRVLTTTAGGVAQWEPRANLAVAKANLTTDGIIVVGDAATGTNTAANAVLAATTLSIKNGSITGGKIAAATIAGGNIATGAIGGGHIAANAVNGNTHITNATIPLGKLANGTANTILTTTAAGLPQWEPRANLAVTKANLTTDGVIVVGDAATGTNTAANAVLAATTLSIKNGSITGGKIAAATIAGGNIAAGAIGGGHIAANAVNGNTHIANATIPLGKLANGTANTILTTTAAGLPQWEPRANLTVTKANLTTDGIIVVGDAATGTNTAANAVLAATTLSIKNGSITGGKIAGGTIGSGHIADNAIITSKIVNRAVTGGKIAAATIAGSNIAAGTITGGNIAGATIATGNIANNAITVDKILNGAVSTAKMANGPANSVLTTNASGAPLWVAQNSIVPNFFYLPPISITITPNTTNKTLNVYDIYKAQYGSPKSKSNAGASLPVLTAAQLNFYVIYADPAVFSTATINASGVLTYSIPATAKPSGATFITIVLQVK